jgi:hypothetical protein
MFSDCAPARYEYPALIRFTGVTARRSDPLIAASQEISPGCGYTTIADAEALTVLRA